MPETNRRDMSYRVLRYTPNLIRDEWVNIGVVLEDAKKQRARATDRGTIRIRTRASAAPERGRDTTARVAGRVRRATRSHGRERRVDREDGADAIKYTAAEPAASRLRGGFRRGARPALS